MKRRTKIVPRAFVTAMALAAAAAIGCDSKPLSGPPMVRLGRDECGECGMIISEDRCSAALLIERDARREYLQFDDVGCMLDVEREGLDGAAVVERHVRDYATRAWIQAERAVFVAADAKKLVTPMSSGIAAFSSVEAAQAALVRYEGKTMDYAALREVRQDWIAQRRSGSAARE